jgi:hypothetical protein
VGGQRADERVEGRRRGFGRTAVGRVANRCLDGQGRDGIERIQDLAQRQLSLRQHQLLAGQRIGASVDADPVGLAGQHVDRSWPRRAGLVVHDPQSMY